jgi:radical SAM protein with 4Fe4S-binding SPASM domain
MRPLIVSVLIAESAPNALVREFLRQLSWVPRARLVARGRMAALSPWLDALEGKRVSLDLPAHEVLDRGVVLAADERLRQVRIAGATASEIPTLVRHVRGGSEAPPIVFLIDPSELAHAPEGWLAVAQFPSVFANPVGSEGSRADATLAAGFARWRRELGLRLFASLPAVAARASDDGAAPCTTMLGMHIVIDADRSCIRLCDCIDEPSIALDAGWLENWRRELSRVRDRADQSCGGCSLWSRCGGGCLAPRTDNLPRDRYCPWPDERFARAGAL